MTSPPHTQPRAVIFDLDNTAYPYPPCHLAGLAAAWTVGGDLDPGWRDRETFERAYGGARRRVKHRLPDQPAAHSRILYFLEMCTGRRNLSTPTAMALDQAYWRAYFQAMRADPLCSPTFQELRRLHIGTAWMTNFTTEKQLHKLRALGLEDAADVLVSSEEAGAEKPDPRILDLTLERLGADPAHTWMVGDNLVADGGVAAARGLPFLWLRRPADRRPADRRPAIRRPAESISVYREVADWPALRRELGLAP